LAHLLVFQFSDSTDRSAPPGYCQCYVRESSDAHENSQIATRQLEDQFGTGVDASSSNTHSKIWLFGRAQVRATDFPPNLNTQKNSRHTAIPGSATECSVIVGPAYCPEMTIQERAAFDSHVPLLCHVRPASNDRPLHVSGAMRWYSNMFGQQDVGFGTDERGRYLIRVIDEHRLEIVSRKWIESVDYIQVLPARGGGGILVDVTYRSSAQVTDRPLRLFLVNEAFEREKHRKLARELACLLGAAFNENTVDDS
jgi:hypothetical protein